MQIKQVMMTPEHAEALLAKNFGNRKLRDHWASELAKMIEKGEWNLTHQAIAIATNGRLLDGQHRLTAIVKAKQTVPVVLAENCDPETFLAIDKGVKRSTADSIEGNKKVVEVISLLLRIAGARSERPTLAKQLMDTEFGFAAIHLLNVCPTTRRSASSAPIKAGAVVQMVKTQKYDTIARNYKNFVSLNYDKMTPLLLQLEKQFASGTTAKDNSDWLFCRAYRAFSPFPSDERRIVITEEGKQRLLSEVREDIVELVDI